MMMDSEDHYDPYNSLYEPPIVTPPPVNPTAFGNLGSQTAVESLPTKKSRNWTLLILPAIFLFVIAGLLCFMVLWLLYRHVNFDASFGSVTNGAIIVDEAAQWCQMLTMTRTSCKSEQAPNLLGLTLSGLMSKAVSFSVTYVMTMAILCAGSSWLKATSSRETKDMPTPLQYALLITMASGTFGSAWEGWCYLIWQKGRPRAPLFVKGTFTSLILLLFLSSAITAADIWVHFSTTTIPLYDTYTVADLQGLKPSLAINSTLCAGALGNTCVFDGTTYWGPPSITDIGNVVAANASTAFQVHSFDTAEREVTAIIVPTAAIPKGMSFQSTSYGVGATCLAAACDPTWFQNGTWSASLGATSLWCAVSGAIGENVNASLDTNNLVTFPLDPNQTTGPSFITYNLLGVEGSSPLDSFSGLNAENPFGMAPLMRWATGLTDGSDGLLVSNYGSSENITWFMGGCNISIYNVELSYTNGTYNLTHRTLSSTNTTTMLFLPFVGNYFTTSFVSRMVVNLGSQLNNYQTDFLTEVARQTSQLGIGLNAGLFSPTETISDVKMERDFLASRYPINAVCVLWTSTALYLIIGVWLLTRAASRQGDILLIEPITKSSRSDTITQSKSMTTTIALAQQRVADPCAIVAEHFVLSASGGRQPNALTPILSIQKKSVNMFGEEECQERLGIGFQNGLSPPLGEGLRKRFFGVAYQDELDEKVTNE